MHFFGLLFAQEVDNLFINIVSGTYKVILVRQPYIASHM